VGWGFQAPALRPRLLPGYGVKTRPAVREAIEQKLCAEAETEIVRVGKVLENEVALIDSAAADLQQATILLLCDMLRPTLISTTEEYEK